MNFLIIYFSQTGGTERIAQKIKQGILNQGNSCDIIGIKEAKSKDLGKYDIIGIGTPTFYYREPVNVRNFILAMEKVDGKHCILFCTHGSIIGNTFYYMNEELANRGYIVIGTFDSYSESSIQFYPKIMHTQNHPDEKEIEEAIEFGEKIYDISLRIQKGEKNLIPTFKLVDDTWWFKQANMLTLDVLRQMYPVFKIDMSKCTQCLTCQNNCPGNTINIESDPPEVQMEGCIYCLYCEKTCPKGAIIADWGQMIRMSRGNLKLYVEALKEAENQGKFRPYVDYEKII